MSIDLPLIKNQVINAKGDSTMSNHYWRQKDIASLTNLSYDSSVNVTLTNVESIPSNLQGDLALASKLSKKA